MLPSRPISTSALGEEDQNPTPAQVARLEEELKRHAKTYELHMYPKAGHGFFSYDRPNYRQEQAVDGWKKLFAFLETYLRTPISSVPAAESATQR
jgi:carboxymethylenebutenolidase